MNTESKWVEAIEAIHKLQTLVDNAMEKVKERKEEISGQLFQLAKECNTVDEFDQRCAYAEGVFKSKHKKGTKIPKHWTQVKSNIKAAMRKDIDLNDHETESSMRKALNEARKAERAESSEDTSERKDSISALDLQVATIRAMLDELPEDLALDACEHFIATLRNVKAAPVYEGEVVEHKRVANA